MKLLTTTALSFVLLFGLFAPVVPSLNIGIEIGAAYAQEERADVISRHTTIPMFQALGAFFITLGAFFMWVAGIVLNYAINYGIVEFALFANIVGVTTAWSVLRDIANIFFIFIFLAIGIGTILNIQQYSVARLLPKLLIVAILVNFSLFFTRVTVDIAHGFAGAILNQSGVVTTNCETVSGSGNCAITHGISAAFVQQFGVVNFFGESTQVALGAGEQERNTYDSIFAGDSYAAAFRAVGYGFFSFIFFTLASIIFLAAAVILIMRIVRLLFLMIASAPAIAAAALPQTQKYFNRWLETLLKEAFFAPILLLLFAISLLFLNTTRQGVFGVSSDASFADIFIKGDIGSASLVIFFLIAFGFLFISLKAAQDFGVMGADAAMKMGNAGRNFWTRRAGAAIGGGAAFLGRNTAGRVGAGAAAGIRGSRFGRSTLGRLTAQTLDRAGAASYDPRAFASKEQQKMTGKPVKGYTGQIKDREKAEKEYSKTLGLTKEEQAKKKSVKDEYDKQEKELKDLLKSGGDTSALESELATVKQERAESNKKYDDQAAKVNEDMAEGRTTLQEGAEQKQVIAQEKARTDEEYQKREEELEQSIAGGGIDRDAINKEIKDIEKARKDKLGAIDKKPQEQYADNLAREVVGKVQQLQLTEDGAKIEKAIESNQIALEQTRKELRKTQEEIRQTRLDIVNAETEEEQRRLRDDQDRLEKSVERLEEDKEEYQKNLKKVKDEKRDLQRNNKYEARTGDYTASAFTTMPTDAAGKLAGAAAIRKELKKDSTKKNLDTLTQALKGEINSKKEE